MVDQTGIVCQLLTRAYFAQVPTDRTLWTRISNALDHALLPSDALTQRVLEACLQHPRVREVPRDPSNDHRVLTWLREEWLARGWPIPLALNTDNSNWKSPGLCYKTYVGYGGESDRMGITLLESSGGIVHGTTGLTTWCGASVLADWVTEHPWVTSGKRVLELGSGIGYTASIILTTHNPDHPPPIAYTATDCHHHVLDLLNHNLNVNLNYPPPKSDFLEEVQQDLGHLVETEAVDPGEVRPWVPYRFPDNKIYENDYASSRQRVAVREGGPDVGVMQVDWRRPCQLPPVDVVLAADVVYARHLIPPLVHLLRCILEGKTSVSDLENCVDDNAEEKEMDDEDEETENEREEKANNETEKVTNANEEDKNKRINEGETILENHREKEENEEEKEEEKQAGKEDADNQPNAGERETKTNREAYIACTRRSHKTLNVFLKEVLNQGLTYSLVYQATLDADTALFVYNEGHLPIKVFRITLPE